MMQGSLLFADAGACKVEHIACLNARQGGVNSNVYGTSAGFVDKNILTLCVKSIWLR
jgi:hypothetical protein